jgi:F-box domain
MDIATRNTILELLPSELIAEILAMLDYRDLVSCMQVRRPSPFFFPNLVLAAQSVVLLTACPVGTLGRCASPF